MSSDIDVVILPGMQNSELVTVCVCVTVQKIDAESLTSRHV